MFAKSLSIVEQKGKEYCGKEQAEGDSLHNYRIHAKIGWNKEEEEYPLDRVLEKIQRLHSMLDNLTISTPKFEEDINDVHNILDYVGLMRRTRLSNTKEKNVWPPPDIEMPGGPAFIKSMFKPTFIKSMSEPMMPGPLDDPRTVSEVQMSRAHDICKNGCCGHRFYQHTANVCTVLNCNCTGFWG